MNLTNSGEEAPKTKKIVVDTTAQKVLFKVTFPGEQTPREYTRVATDDVSPITLIFTPAVPIEEFTVVLKEPRIPTDSKYRSKLSVHSCFEAVGMLFVNWL